MMFLLHIKFRKIPFRSLRGVALTNFVMDTWRDGTTDKPKTICLPTKVGGDIMCTVRDNEFTNFFCFSTFYSKLILITPKRYIMLWKTNTKCILYNIQILPNHCLISLKSDMFFILGPFFIDWINLKINEQKYFKHKNNVIKHNK